MDESGMEEVGFELARRTTVMLSRDLVRRAKESLGGLEHGWRKVSMTEAIGRALELAIAWGWKMPEVKDA